jgi:hypothetical protein
MSLKNMLNKNIPNTSWNIRSNYKNMTVCCTCRTESFNAKIIEELDGYSYKVQGNNIVYRDKVKTLDDLIADVSTVFNTLDMH